MPMRRRATAAAAGLAGALLAGLLPACAARLAGGGAIYAEAGRPLAAPPGLEIVRAGRAGQVHYHLLTSRPAGEGDLAPPDEATPKE